MDPERATRSGGDVCDVTIELLRAEKTDDPYAFRFAEQTYVAPEARRSARFPWGDAVLEDLAAVGGARPDPDAAARLGHTLRAFLVEVGFERDEARIARALDEKRPIRITIRAGAAELYALPWELVPLKGAGSLLGELPGCLLQYAWPGTETARPDPSPPPEGGRVLFAWSAAGGAVPAAQHLDAIRRAATDGHHPFDDAADVVPHASIARLDAALCDRPGEPVAALHLLCHGGRVPSRSEVYGLVLDGADSGDGPDVLDAGALRRLLAPHARTLRLVVICACWAGNPGALGSHVGSLAQALHQIGIPAVVASRAPLAVDASIDVATALYHGLLVDLVALEDAFLAARGRLGRRAGSLDWASLQLYARPADGPDHRPFVMRPYRGLLVFEPRHRACFFGRDAEIAEVLSDLGALIDARDGSRPRFLVVAGGSGTGKSSLVFAGVVPALVEARRFEWVSVRPGRALPARVDAALAGRDPPGAPLLVVVDQFEELFTGDLSAPEREAIVRRLFAIAADPASGASVIATLRVDFIGRCGEVVVDDRGLRLDKVAYDEAHRVFLAQMTRAQMREVIERPAQRVGLVLEAGLADRMLDDVGAEPGALALLEYALDQVWQRREGGVLTQAAYQAIGGVAGALEREAERLLQTLDAPHRNMERRLLAQLVAVRDDAALDTRRRVAVAEIRPEDASAAAAFDEVLQALVAARLVVLDEQGGVPVVEVAHEELIRSWPLLRSWVQEDREKLAHVARLRAWAAEWQKFPEALLAGDRLGYAREIQATYPDAIDRGVAALIAASAAAEAKQHRQTRFDNVVRVLLRGVGGCLLLSLLVTACVMIAEVRGCIGPKSKARVHDAGADAAPQVSPR